MKERIAKLIDVKTLITFAIVGLTVYLGAIESITPDKVFELVLIIISFYFGTQSMKGKS